MTKRLWRIIIGAAVLATAVLLSLNNEWLQIALFIISYIIVGGDVVIGNVPPPVFIQFVGVELHPVATDRFSSFGKYHSLELSRLAGLILIAIVRRLDSHVR